MPRIKGFDVGVTIDGNVLQEYDLRETEANGSPIVECYIASQIGKEFAITLKPPPAARPLHYSFELLLDKAKPRLNESIRRLHPDKLTDLVVMREQVTVRHDGVETSQAFEFAALERTGDDAALEMDVDRLGEICVLIYSHEGHVPCIGSTNTGSCYTSTSRGQLYDEPIHERKKKGLITHRVKYGESRVLSSSRYWQVYHMHRTNSRLEATIVFKYRELEILVAQGIAPRSLLQPSVGPRVGTGSVLGRRSRSEAVDLEELSELQDYYQARLSCITAIMSRHRETNQRPSTETPEGAATREVIDLTNAD